MELLGQKNGVMKSMQPHYRIQPHMWKKKTDGSNDQNDEYFKGVTEDDILHEQILEDFSVRKFYSLCFALAQEIGRTFIAF